MQITYLGHAGFLVETPEAVVVTDPWMSEKGAFDSAWFQYPCNHHLAPFLREKLQSSEKPVFVYISHEHRDHFDPEFLKTLPVEKITFLVPHFERPALRQELAELHPANLIAANHKQAIPIPGGMVRLFLDDSGINRDSAVLVNANGHTFLNLNDCKLYDQLPAIRAEDGPVSVLACQFSGATYHPTCYEYDRDEYERISRQKRLGKFEMVARAIDELRPKVYLASAGPACFLDPTLLHLNFEPVNIFPRAPEFLEFLHGRLQCKDVLLPDVTPGDILDVCKSQVDARGGERVSEETFERYVRSYADRYRNYFADRQPRYEEEKLDELVERLKEELQNKLSSFSLHARVQVPMYFGFTDAGHKLLRINFAARTVEPVQDIAESDYYSLRAPSWQVSRLLDHATTWEEFALSFRMRLNRKPDIYQTLIQGFLLMEPEDMNWFCARVLELEQRGKRFIVEAEGTRYSIDRFCPHQGADLSQGWLAEGKLWTCPRHRWQFSLDKEGRCLTSTGTINAVCLEND